MKNNFLSHLKIKVLFYLSCLCLITFVIVSPFASDLSSYLEKQIAAVTLSLGLLFELKTIASSSSSSHIPLISGASTSALETLTNAIKYLSWSDVLISTQLIFITLSKSILLKVAILIAFVGSFISKYRTASLKLLVLLLLINPGLPAYVSGIKYLAQEAKLDLGNDLAQELQKNHENYLQRESENKKQEELRNTKQKAAAQAKGKDKISIFKRIEDKAADDIKKVDAKVIEGVSDSYKVLKFAGKEITIMSINLFTTVVIQFLLLPFLYFFGLFTLFKRFLTATVIDEFLEKILVIETAVIVIILTLSLI